MECPQCQDKMISVDRVEEDSLIVIFYYCESCDTNYSAEYRLDELQKQ